MKTINKIWVLGLIIGINVSSFAQAPQTPDSLGLPGDNLNLYGVLALFKESKSVEDFEQKLNTPDNKVNNLDLNHDGQTDYIRVVDYGKNGLHSLVLQDPITATESQDVAVIETEQQGDGVAHVQIVGDEDLYGKNYIIEPQDQEQSQQQAPPVDNTNYNQSAPPPQVYVNVWAWPSIQFMYGPSYVYWNSPWYWGYYPHWWSPWRPLRFHTYWVGMYGYRAYQHRIYENHIIAAHSIYYGHRQASVIVHNNIQNHVYYGPRGGKVAGASPHNTPKAANTPRQQTGGKTAFNNGGHLKQQTAPKQQTMPRQQVQAPPKQQGAVPRPQAQASPRQQSIPRQQAAPHNMGGGGARMGGGGHGGGRR